MGLSGCREGGVEWMGIVGIACCGWVGLRKCWGGWDSDCAGG